jgi:anti-sigma28 factor (negative regulator of flagellin synthesis)
LQIKGINNSVFSQTPSKVDKPGSTSSSSKKDRIEISSQARDISKSDLGSQRLEEIKQKLKNKFYDTEEVLSKVADAILKELDNE